MVPLWHKAKQFSGGSLLRRNMSMTFGRQMLAAFAQFVLVVIIARELGPAGNGFYAMAILLPTMLATFLNLGVGPATVYHVSRKTFAAHQAKQGNIKLALMIAIVGVLVSLPVVLLWGERLFPGIPLSLLLIGLVSFPIALLLAFMSSILQGLEDFKAFNLSVLLPPFVNLFFVIIALYVFDLGVAGALYAHILGLVVGLVAVLVFLKRSESSSEKTEAAYTQSDYGRKSLSYGLRAHMSNILAFVNYRADLFLVNFFLSPVATGVYVIAVQIAEKIWMLSQAASTVLLPRLSAMHENPTARLDLTNKSFWVVSALTALLSALVGIMLYWLLTPIFGEGYAEALPVFSGYCRGLSLEQARVYIQTASPPQANRNGTCMSRSWS